MRFPIAVILISTAALISSVSADIYNCFNLDGTAFLFVDHQTGLFSLVQDYNPDTYYTNVIVGRADTAKYLMLLLS